MRVDLHISEARVAHLFNQGLSAKVIAARLNGRKKAVELILNRNFGTTEPAKPYCAEMDTPAEVLAAGLRPHGYHHSPKWIEHNNGSNAA